MQEIQRKGLKDLFKKIVKSASDAEKSFHGNVGRQALDAADYAGSKLPKALSPEEYSQADMDKAMKIWKEQGMGKIGKKPDGDRFMNKPNGDHYMEKPKGDHYMNKPKGDYVRKIEDPEGWGKPYSQGGEMGKYEFFGQFNNNKTPKDNLVMRREPPSKGEIAAGRAITGGSALGYGAAKAHSYWTDKKNEQNK